MNRNAYYALRSRENDVPNVEAIPGVSFNGGSELTFSMDFLGLGNGELFSQEGSVSCCMQDGKLYWKTQSAGTLVSSDQTPFIDDDWNRVDVVYGGDKIALYINGCPSNETALAGQGAAGSAAYMFLKNNGAAYLRNIRLSDVSMTQEQILQQLVNTKKDAHLLLYIPCDRHVPTDLGKYQRIVKCPGGSGCVTLLSSLCIAPGGYVMLHREEVNPGSADMAEWSLLLCVYQEASEDPMTLYVNEAEVENELFLLQTENGYVDIIAGAFHGRSDNALDPYTWHTLIVTCKGKKLSCYADGKLFAAWDMGTAYIRTLPADMYLCGREDRNVSLTGSMDLFAVYDAALTEAEALDYETYEPYLFDAHMKSLYIFHDGENEDYLSGAKAMLSSGVKLGLLEGTEDFDEDPIIIYRMDGDFDVDDYYKWETKIATNVMGCFQKKMTGVEPPENLPSGFKNWNYSHFTETMSVQSMICERDTPSPAKMRKAVNEAAARPHYANIMTAGLSDTITAASHAATSRYIKYFLAAGGLGVGTALTLGIICIAEVLQDSDDPPSPPDDYKAKLKSIEFCHADGSKSSLLLRKNDTDPADVPEWREGAAGGVCAYIGKKQEIEITAGFHYTANDPGKTETIVLGGKVRGEDGSESLFGNFESEAVTCRESGNYSARITLTENTISEETAAGRHREKIMWYFVDSKGEHPLPSTEIDVHILHGGSIWPWSLTESKDAPILDELDHFHEMLTASACGDRKAGDVLGGFAAWLGQNEKLVFQMTASYAAIDAACLYFDEKRFRADRKAESMKAGALDLCAYVLSLMCMEGYEGVSVCRIAGEEDIVMHCGEPPSVSATGLLLNPHCVLGKENTGFLSTHYVMKADDQIYDLVLQDKDKKPFIGISFEDYEGAIATPGSAFCEAHILQYYLRKEEAGRLSAPLEVIYREKAGFIQAASRPPFAKYITGKYYFPANQDCCHRVSYKTIEDIFLSTFNSLKKQNGIDKTTMNTVLDLVDKAFYPAVPSEDKEREAYYVLREALTKLKLVSREDLQDKNKCKDAAKYITTAIRCLNSCSDNLRVGYSTWNASLGKAFDALQWTYVTQIWNPASNKICSYKMCNEKGFMIPPVELNSSLAEGIYLYDPVDVRLLKNLIEINQLLRTELKEPLLQLGVCAAESPLQTGRYPVAVLKSSANAYNLKDTKQVVLTSNFYYLDPDTNISVKIET